jgi:hypothetical protein
LPFEFSFSTLYKPDKLVVGYNKRSDTYTDLLAFVTYQEDKKLAREKTFLGWIDKERGTTEYDNEPRSGFALNGNVGGVGSGYYNDRTEKFRVLDPNGFEVEITSENLLMLLHDVGCKKGGEFAAKLVYAWDKSRLTLVPEGTAIYDEMMRDTGLRSVKTSLKSLKVGDKCICKDKSKRVLTYIGKHQFADARREILARTKTYKHLKELKDVPKRHVFLDEATGEYLGLSALKSIAYAPELAPTPNTQVLVGNYYESKHVLIPKKIFTIREYVPNDGERYIALNRPGYADVRIIKTIYALVKYEGEMLDIYTSGRDYLDEKIDPQNLREDENGLLTDGINTWQPYRVSECESSAPIAHDMNWYRSYDLRYILMRDTGKLLKDSSVERLCREEFAHMKFRDTLLSFSSKVMCSWAERAVCYNAPKVVSEFPKAVELGIETDFGNFRVVPKENGVFDFVKMEESNG